MSHEPGLTLGRLVAAERNALAALEALKHSQQQRAELAQRLARIEADNVRLAQRVDALTARVVVMMGTGATVR